MESTDLATTEQLQRTLRRLAGPPTSLSDAKLHRAGLRKRRQLRRRNRALSLFGIVALVVASQLIIGAFQSSERVGVATSPTEAVVPVNPNPVPSPEQFLDAVRSDDPLAVVVLLEAGADIDAVQRADVTPLMVATIRNNLEVATILLDADADVTLFSEPGFGVLHLAAQYGEKPLIELLVQHGAEVDVASTQVAELTPLMLAARAGRIEAVDALLDAGADPWAVDSNGRTASWYGFDDSEVFERLRAAEDAAAVGD